MTRLHASHQWTTLLSIYKMPAASENICGTHNGLVECPWPYGPWTKADGSTGTNYSSSHHLIDMDAGILGASHKRTVQGVNLQKGFYIIQAKAYGYTGGAYRMEVYSAEGGSPIPARGTTSTAYDSDGCAHGSTSNCHIQYGETKFGMVSVTGETHVYTFPGKKDDVIRLSVGPDWQPDGTDLSNYCGKPLTQGGKLCLDTTAVLVAPSGEVESEAHASAGTSAGWNDVSRIGSYIDTVSAGWNGYYFEDGNQGPLGAKGGSGSGVVAHRLKEDGTYTIVAGGSAATDASGLSYRQERSAFGGYFLTLEQVGTSASKYSLAYATPPAGHGEVNINICININIHIDINIFMITLSTRGCRASWMR